MSRVRVWYESNKLHEMFVPTETQNNATDGQDEDGLKLEK